MMRVRDSHHGSFLFVTQKAHDASKKAHDASKRLASWAFLLKKTHDASLLLASWVFFI